ncbi:hypothetical protein EI94DRAFT_1787084 [Lactarius quietus]|nr:hypothetical protein EI94DRAFT_1787084 [Lactarius quietus]
MLADCGFRIGLLDVLRVGDEMSLVYHADGGARIVPSSMGIPDPASSSVTPSVSSRGPISLVIKQVPEASPWVRESKSPAVAIKGAIVRYPRSYRGALMHVQNRGPHAGRRNRSSSWFRLEPLSMRAILPELRTMSPAELEAKLEAKMNAGIRPTDPDINSGLREPGAASRPGMSYYADNTPSVTTPNLPASYSEMIQAMPAVPLPWIFMFATKPPTLSMIPERRTKEIMSKSYSRPADTSAALNRFDRLIPGSPITVIVYAHVLPVGPACKTGQWFSLVLKGKGERCLPVHPKTLEKHISNEQQSPLLVGATPMAMVLLVPQFSPARIDSVPERKNVKGPVAREIARTMARIFAQGTRPRA